MQALHSGIGYISLIGASISLYIYGGIEHVQLQCQSPGWSAVPTDYGMQEQWPLRLSVVQGAWDSSRNFLQLGQQTKEEDLLWNPRINFKSGAFTGSGSGSGPLLNFNSKAENPESMLLCQPALASPICTADIPARIEIYLGNAIIRFANGTDPAILDRILSLVKGTVC